MTRRGRRERRRFTPSAKFDQRRKRSYQQLGLAVLALVMLIIFWDQLAQGTAGCFHKMSDDDKGTTAAPAATTPSDAGASEPDRQGPSVRIKLPESARQKK